MARKREWRVVFDKCIYRDYDEDGSIGLHRSLMAGIPMYYTIKKEPHPVLRKRMKTNMVRLTRPEVIRAINKKHPDPKSFYLKNPTVLTKRLCPIIVERLWLDAIEVDKIRYDGSKISGRLCDGYDLDTILGAFEGLPFPITTIDVRYGPHVVPRVEERRASLIVVRYPNAILFRLYDTYNKGTNKYRIDLDRDVLIS